MTLREGFSPEEGGAIQSWSPGLVRVEDSEVLDNFASKTGGGINNAEPEGYPWLLPPLPMPKSGRSRSSTRRSPATARAAAAPR